jgi:GNAT superfamily N-acetyltransferase
MTELEIRDMTAGDVDAAEALYRSGGWGERRAFLERVMGNPACQSLVGIRGGAVVATGLATINGPVGWVGSIFVDPSVRRQGLGRALTEAVCARIDAAGCVTQALVASEYGRPLYEQMDFRIDAWYEVLEATPIGAVPTPPLGTALRRMHPDDMDRVSTLDRRATGEDRRRLLTPLSDASWVLEGGDELLGYLISIMPGSAALIAPDPEDAACLLDLFRHLAVGRAKTARATIVAGNSAAEEFLGRRGWKPTFETPRMLRGRSIEWEPALIWGLLGFAFG